jgi:competence transcription factor ComK
MNKTGYKIKIMNEKFGDLINETFVDQTQFKLFLKMVHASVELKEDLTFFNGETFYVHIPYKVLSDSVIVTKVLELNLNEQVRSKIEALVTV